MNLTTRVMVPVRLPYRRRLSARLLAAAFIFAFLGPANSPAQTDAALASMQAKLLGNPPRTWVKDRVVLSMGSHGDCTSGETYRFKADGTVTITRCKAQKLVKQIPEPNWKITRLGPLDVRLAFDGRAYLLSFGGPPPAQQMRWQHLGPSKIQLTEDIYLGISKD